MTVGVAQETSVLEEVDGPWIHVVLHEEPAEGLQVVLGRDEAEFLAVPYTVAVRVGETKLFSKSMAIGGEV